MSDLGEILALLSLAGVLAFAIEAFIKRIPVPTAYKEIASTLIGLAIAVGYDFDMIEAFMRLADRTPTVPYIGSIVTGLFLGRGANLFHDLIVRLRTVPAPATSAPLVNYEAEQIMNADQKRIDRKN